MKNNIRKFLKEINQEFHTTILLTTHDLSDIEALCSRVIVLDQGKIIYDGDLHRLKNEWGSGKTIYLRTAEDLSIDQLERITEGLSITWNKQAEREMSAVLKNGISVSTVLSRLVEQVPIQDVQIKEDSTEEIVRKIYQGG